MKSKVLSAFLALAVISTANAALPLAFVYSTAMHLGALLVGTVAAIGVQEDKPAGLPPVTVYIQHKQNEPDPANTQEQPRALQISPFAPRTYNSVNYSPPAGMRITTAASTTLDAAVSSLSSQMQNPSVSDAVWYGKLEPIGTTTDSSGTILIQYKVKSDFILGACASYKKDAILSYGNGASPVTSFASPCTSGKTENDIRKFMQNNATYRAAEKDFLPDRVTVTPASCDTGYTYNNTTDTCQATNPAAAPIQSDEKCFIGKGADNKYTWDANDIDCRRAQERGSISKDSTTGAATVTTKDPVTQQTTTTKVIPKANADTDVEVDKYDPSSKISEGFKGVINKLGEVVEALKKPTEYRPTGPSGSSVAPTPVVITGGSTGDGTKPCGTAADPCHTKGLETDSELNIGEDFSTEEIEEPNALDSIFSTMDAFKRLEIPETNTSCEAALSSSSQAGTLSFSNLGSDIDVDMSLSKVCPFLDEYKPTISYTFQVIYLVIAIVMFIRLTI